MNVKKAAQVTQFSLFTISVGFYFFFIFGGLNELFLSVLSLLSGIATSAHNPVRLSLAPRLVNHGAVSSVVSIVAINFNLARLTGPAIAGWLIAVWGLQITLLVQSLLYLPFILMLNLLHPRDQVALKAGKEPFRAALHSGVKHMLSNSLMRHALLITSLYAFLIRGTLEILPVIADGIFAKGAAGLGILTSIAGFGAVVAGITKVFTQSQKAGEIPKFVIASALLGVALIPLVGLSNTWELTVGYICYLGFAGTLSGISIQTALQMDLPDHFRGRVMSLWTVVNVGATATGAMILGGLADYIGIPTAFCFAGGIGTVLLITAVLKNR